MAVLSRLIPIATASFAIQTVGALVFVPLQEDRFYDLTGCLGFLGTTLISLYYPALKDQYWHTVLGVKLPPLSSFAPRQLLLNAALGVWALRLGAFLFHRALKSGGESRLDEIKKRPSRFSFSWFVQGTWTFLVGIPVYLANILPISYHSPLGTRDYIFFALFVASFALEVTSDIQKSVWRAKKNRGQHNEKFITSGLWGISRHPNYVGELGIWTGIWALSTTSLQHPYFPRITPILAGISPLMTWCLLTRVSGIPLLEKAAEKKWGDDPQWKEYKRRVPVLWPWSSNN